MGLGKVFPCGRACSLGRPLLSCPFVKSIRMAKRAAPLAEADNDDEDPCAGLEAGLKTTVDQSLMRGLATA